MSHEMLLDITLCISGSVISFFMTNVSKIISFVAGTNSIS